MKDLLLNGTIVIYALAYAILMIFFWALYIRLKYHTPIDEE